MGMAETARLAVRIDLGGNALTGIDKLTRKVNTLGGASKRVGKGIGQIGVGLGRAGLLVGGAVATGLAAAAKAGGDFEAQLNIINTIARETPDGLTRIGDGIRKLARDGRGDLADLSAGYYDILSAGIQAADAQGVLEAATTLATGSLSTNAEAVDLLTTAINAYGQDASSAAADADLFAKAVELGKVKADEIAASFANVAPIAAQTGINIEEIAAAYAALTAQGTPAAEVTTQMSRAILDLLSPNKELNNLQKATHQNFMDIAKDKGLVVALQAMRDAVDGDDKAFKQLFGRVEGYKFALQTTGPQQQKYNDALEAMGQSAGTAAEQMAERRQGLNFQLQRFKANLIDAALELSAGFLPSLAKSLDKLSGALSDPTNRKSLRSIGKDIGKSIDKIDWQKVLDGAKDFVSVMRGALDFTLQILNAVNKLPTEIKAAAAGLLVLNKASGGLVGAGVGNIVGGLGEAVTRSLGTKLPGVGKLFAQPVFVTNWPVGFGGGGGLPGAAGGGGLKGALGNVAKIVLPAAALLAAIEVSGVNDPKHQQLDPRTGRTRTFRGTNDKNEQLTNIDNTLRVLRERTDAVALKQIAQLMALRESLVSSQAPVVENVKTLQAEQAKARELNKAGQKDIEAATNETKRETTRGAQAVAASTRAGSSSVVAAIYANRPIITTNVRVNATTVSKEVTVNNRYGPSGGSRNSDSNGSGTVGNGGR
jgi:TP901 family phage tail tape measure protein